METKRNIKQENEIINNIVDNVKKSYVLKLNNYSNYDNFINNVINKIKDGCYNYFSEDNQKDPVMGRFCKYMVQTFQHEDYPWFNTKDKKRVESVEVKLLTAIDNADLKRYAYEHLDEIEVESIRIHLKNMFE